MKDADRNGAAQALVPLKQSLVRGPDLRGPDLGQGHPGAERGSEAPYTRCAWAGSPRLLVRRPLYWAGASMPMHAAIAG